MRPPYHAVGLPTGQAPRLLVQPRGGCLFHVDHLPAPAAIILGFGYHLAVAHRVQHRQQRRPHRQKIHRQPRQVQKCGVEQLQLALVVKDCQTNVQMGKGLGQGLHEVAQTGFRLHRHVGRQGKDQPQIPLTHHVQIVPRRPTTVQRQLLALPRNALGTCRTVKQPRQRPGQFLPRLTHIPNPQKIGTIRPDHIAIPALAPDQDRRLGDGIAQKIQFIRHRPQRHQVLPGMVCIALGVQQHQPRHTAAQFGLQYHGIALARR